MSPDAHSEPLNITVAILTYNSMETIEETIRSVADFDEVLACDGGSTDGTRDRVVELGCVLIDQGDEYTDDEGHLINMTGVREQMLAAAAHDWVFVLDHDEVATAELVAEMRLATAAPRVHGAYEVPRLYVLDGEVIRCAANYPSYQTRLVYRPAVAGYAGIIHDHPVLREGESTGTLREAQLVPQPPLRELWPKWLGYMRLEEVGTQHLSRPEWVQQVLRPERKKLKWLLYRLYKVRRTCNGRRFPLRYELGRMVYEVGVVFYTGRRYLGLGKSDARQAWK